MPHHIISAGIEATPGNDPETVRAMLAELQHATAFEPGCISFQIRQNAEDPKFFVLWEVWADKAAMEAHFEAPHTKKVLDSGVTRIRYIEPLRDVAAPQEA